MQVNPAATGHQSTKTCKAMHAARLQQKAVSDSAVVMDAEFYTYGEELERVEVFKYLGSLIAFDDDDTQAVRGNLAKAATSGRGSHTFCGQRTRPPAYVACSTKSPCSLSFYLRAKRRCCCPPRYGD